MKLKHLLCTGLVFAAVFFSYGGTAVPRIDLRQYSGRAKAPGLSVRVQPMAYLDNLFCVLQGQEQPIAFSFIDGVPGKAKKPLIFKVTVPKGFSLDLKYRYMKLISSKKLKNGSVESTYEVKVPHYTANISDWGCAYGRISTNLKPDGKRYKMHYSVRSADGHGGSFSTDLMAIAPESAPQPKLFKTGFVFCGLWATSLNEKEAVRGAGLVKSAGVNIVAADYNTLRPFHKELKKAGVTRCWGWRVFLGDGYLMGVAPKPESVKFRNAENKWVGRGICPEEAVSQGAYFRKHFLAELERMMYREDYGEHYMANWEPIIFSKQGCFCPRCKTAFLKFSKLPKGDVEKIWPKGILKKYKKEWQHFRATQHAKIVVNIQNFLKTLDKKYNRKSPSYFLPEIACANLLEGNEKYLGDFYKEYDARYYENSIPALEPWGPYLMHDFLGSYRALPGRHIVMTMLAKEIIQQLKKRNKGNRPKLFAFPQGIQCGSWVTTPEAMAFETLVFFVTGWEGSLLYAFPNGYDGRYWNHLARANRLIAAHENFVCKGEKFSGIKVKTISPYPKGAGIDTYSTSGKYFANELKKGSMLRAFGFKQGKSYCIALANAWERGKVVTSLQLSGIPSGNYKIRLSDSAKVKHGFVDGKKLRSGINVEVPALDWLFVTLEPVKEGKGSLPSFRLGEKEKKELARNAARDNALLNQSSRIPEYRFDDTPMISAGPVTVRPKKGCKIPNSILQVTAPGYRGELLMANGGIFSHIKPKKITIKNGSFIGGDGVWGEYTGSTNTEPFTFEKWSADGDEVSVTLKSNPSIFAGMQTVKTYVFSPEKIKVSVRITNTDDAPFILNYRLRSYFRMMAPPRIFCGKTPIPAGGSLFAVTSGKNTARPFRRTGSFHAIGATKVTASVPGRKEDTLLADYLKSDSGIYFWRSKNGQEFTAEKTYPTIKLLPGKWADFGAELSFRRGK